MMSSHHDQQEQDTNPRDPSGILLWADSSRLPRPDPSSNNINDGLKLLLVEADQRTEKTQPESTFHEHDHQGDDEEDNHHDGRHDEEAGLLPSLIPSLLPSYNFWHNVFAIGIQSSQMSVISELSGTCGGVEVTEETNLEEEKEEQDYEDAVLHDVEEDEVIFHNTFDVVVNGSNANYSDAEVPSSDFQKGQEVITTGRGVRQRHLNNNMFLLRFQWKDGKINLVEDDPIHHFLHYKQAVRPLMTSSQLRGLINFSIRLATRYHQISIRCWIAGILLLVLGISYILYGIFPFPFPHHDDKVFGLTISLGSGIPLVLAGILFVVLGQAHQPSRGSLFAEEFNNSKKLFLRYHNEAITTTSEKVPGIKIHYRSQQSLLRFSDDETVLSAGQHDRHDQILFGLEVHVVSSSLNIV